MSPTGTETHPVVPAEPAAVAHAPAATPACPHCATPLRDDQEWCLNCGAAARTRVAAPAGWRTPMAILGAVAALALAGLVVAFLAISDDSTDLTRVAQTPTPAPAAATPVPATTPAPAPAPTVAPAATIPPATAGEQPAATPAPAPDSGAVGTWPDGKSAFTVVLQSSPTRSSARKRAKELAAGGTPVGVLESGDYKTLRAGFFVVFSGQYDSRDAAEKAAEDLSSKAAGAYVRRVTPR